MSKTPSHMVPLGTKAPAFSLLDPRTNLYVSLEETHSKIATVIMFLSNHCPYVKHIQTTLVAIAKDFQPKGITFIAICANDVEKYPADHPLRMKEIAEEFDYTFPYLYDETQAVAKAYNAACTPDFYIFDKDLACVYRGCMDESTPGNGVPLTGSHLRAALDAIIEGKVVDSQQKPSLGCNIKWK